jgi:predicted anti-sigma-YlaC factor YlaD
MKCCRIRQGVSARLDGEDPGPPDAVIDADLAGCEDCRTWQVAAASVSSLVPLASALDVLSGRELVGREVAHLFELAGLGCSGAMARHHSRSSTELRLA